MNIILASASPRRKELLKYLYDDFNIVSPDMEEIIPESVAPEEGPEYLAVQKALSVAVDHPHSLVIGCDTQVFYDCHVLGKPTDANDAARMLKILSGRTHQVITGCCICLEGKQISFSESTKVKFYQLTNQEIEDYVDTGECIDKAGSYAIQGRGCVIVKGIEGDYYNVMGLPVAKLKRVIATFLSI